MNIGSRAGVGIVLAAIALAALVHSQSLDGGSSAPRRLQGFAQPVQAASQPLGVIFREIDDPHTRDCWLLIRDAKNPAGPGHLVRMGDAGAGPGQGKASDARQTGDSAESAARLRPVIHAGDALIVEEHTAVVDARLEAVALGSAAAGAQFKARLKIGGKVVRVVALGAGRAALTAENEAQP